MRKKFQALLFLLTALSVLNIPVQAQIFEGAKWTFRVEQTDSCEAVLIFKATTIDKFHIYSQKDNGNDESIPTTFTFKKSADYQLVGKVQEGHAEEVFDQQFQMKVKFFHGETEFKQKIKITTRKKFNVEGYVNYMACDDEKCLPPTDVDFSFAVNAAKMKSCMTTENNPAVEKTTAEVVPPVAATPVADTLVTETADTVVVEAGDNAVITELEPAAVKLPVEATIPTKVF